MSFVFPPSLSLANLPTPVERMRAVPELPDLPNVYVKRDDLTGSALSGNKVRKLEFALAEAAAADARAVVTCGGVQSNHARATAVAAARLGLRPVLVLRGSRAGRERRQRAPRPARGRGDPVHLAGRMAPRERDNGGDRGRARRGGRKGIRDSRRRIRIRPAFSDISARRRRSPRPRRRSGSSSTRSSRPSEAGEPPRGSSTGRESSGSRRACSA